MRASLGRPPRPTFHEVDDMVEFSHGSVQKRVWTYGGKARTAYAYCFTYVKDGKTLRARGQAATRSEALEAMDARKAELAKEPEVAPAPVLTLNAYADTWLKGIASSVEPRTVDSYLGMLKKHVRPTLGALQLDKITRGQVKDLLATKRAGGLSKDTVRLIRSTLSGLYADAIDAELVISNPAARTGRARGRKTPDSVSSAERRQKTKAMSVEQLAVFLKAAQDVRHANLFLLLADTGMRPGEAFALTWKDVDLAAHVVNVERAVSRGGRLKGTKTEAARTVDLTPRLAAALDALQARQEAEALAADREVPTLVFPSEAGTLLDDINVAKRFQAVLTRAGLPKFRLYDLRHTYASHLLALGAPITYVSAQLGHAKPTTTLAHYAHWLPRGDHGLADKLEAARTGALAAR